MNQGSSSLAADTDNVNLRRSFFNLLLQRLSNQEQKKIEQCIDPPQFVIQVHNFLFFFPFHFFFFFLSIDMYPLYGLFHCHTIPHIAEITTVLSMFMGFLQNFFLSHSIPTPHPNSINTTNRQVPYDFTQMWHLMSNQEKQRQKYRDQSISF